MERFLIGNLLFETDYAGVPLLSEGNLRQFAHPGPWEGERVTLKCTCEPLAPFLHTPLTPENMVYGLYRHEGETALVYHWGNQLHGFAVWPERFAVSFDPVMYHQPAVREDWFFSICGFHRQLLLREACVLHASYIDIGGEAILFTGPSNVGKSTQADLWVRHCGAQVINGDRALLRSLDGRWHVFGYPCCGTSGICINRTLPLRAIVVLSQAPDNHITELPAAAKIRSLVPAMEQYPWDTAEFDMALKVATSLAAEIPVLKLHCTPDQRAVEVLKHHLEGGSRHDPV